MLTLRKVQQTIYLLLSSITLFRTTAIIVAVNYFLLRSQPLWLVFNSRVLYCLDILDRFTYFINVVQDAIECSFARSFYVPWLLRKEVLR